MCMMPWTDKSRNRTVLSGAKSFQKRGRGMLMVIWTAGLDVPRHTTAEPERWGLAAAAGSRTSKEAWRHGTALVLPASSHANRPCRFADLGRPWQDGQVI